MELVKLNLGCGNCVPVGWINVDYAFGAKLAKIPIFRAINKKVGFFKMDWDERIKLHDLRKPFPFQNGSIDIIYTSHTLEHLSKQEGKQFLKECHRVLKTSGIIRIVVPDLECIVYQYTCGNVSADMFLDKLCVVCDTSGMGLFKRTFANKFYYPHKCMYDNKMMLALLHEMGFKAESRNSFDSDIADIRQIEIYERTKNAVIVEGKTKEN